MPILIEVAIATLADAQTAHQAGATRLELSSALQLGGLTPSLGTLQTIKSTIPLPIIAMLRPRPAGFVYSPSDFITMHRDAALLLESGAAGLAFGFLTSDRKLDIPRIAQFVKLITTNQSVFHRAFDLVPNPLEALERLIDLGITRILTSGQKPAAAEGADLIQKLIERAAGRIEILPASGITPENAADLVAQTGATQLHGSFSEPREDPAMPVCPSQYSATSARRIRAIRATFNLH